MCNLRTKSRKRNSTFSERTLKEDDKIEVGDTCFERGERTCSLADIICCYTDSSSFSSSSYQFQDGILFRVRIIQVQATAQVCGLLLVIFI